MIINNDYVNWLANTHRLVSTVPGQLAEHDPWRLCFSRDVPNAPVITVYLWALNRTGDPSRAAVSIGNIRHSIRGARRITNNLGRVMAAIEQLHLCDISAP